MSTIPQDIQDAISSEDTDRLLTWLRGHPEPSYRNLEECLTIAMPTGSLRMIKTLLDHGATLREWSFGALFNRAEPAVFQQLIDHGWDINSTEFETPAIHRAQRNESLLRWLLDHGGDANVKSVRRGSALQPCTALATAARKEDPTALRILLSYGAEMDPLALFHAIGRRSQTHGIATMAVLIEHGADVNYMAKNWGTPLVRAVRFNAKEKVLYLLEHGADPTIRIPVRKMTPAEYAQKQGHQELYEILKEAEAAHAEH